MPWGLETIYSSTAHWRNVEMTNNILSNIGSQEIYTDGATDITPVAQYNLVASSFRSNGNVSASNNVVGLPLFVNAPNDFHLQNTSPAKNAGASLANYVTLDYDGIPRPQESTYDIGAFEYCVGP